MANDKGSMLCGRCHSQIDFDLPRNRHGAALCWGCLQKSMVEDKLSFKEASLILCDYFEKYPQDYLTSYKRLILKIYF